MHESIKTAFRAAAWLLLIVIVILSVVPPEARPVTPAPHDIEHLGIFLLTGMAFGIGYSAYLLELCGLVLFSGAIELVQLMIPGRHARLSDFVVDAISISLGVGIGIVASRWLCVPKSS